MGALLPAPDYVVDLAREDLTIVVHVYHSVALVSVLPEWHAMRHYNVHELVEEALRGAGGAPVDTNAA